MALFNLADLFSQVNERTERVESYLRIHFDAKAKSKNFRFVLFEDDFIGRRSIDSESLVTNERFRRWKRELDAILSRRAIETRRGTRSFGTVEMYEKKSYARVLFVLTATME